MALMVGVPLNEYTRMDFPKVVGDYVVEVVSDSLTGEQYPLHFISVKGPKGPVQISVDPKSVRAAARRDKETVL